MQSTRRGDVIDISARARQKTDILSPTCGLCLAELFHATIPFAVSGKTYAPALGCPVGGAENRQGSVRQGSERQGYRRCDSTVASDNSPNPLKRVLVTVE